MEKKILFILTVVLFLLPASLRAEEAVRLTRFQGQKITGVTAGGSFDVELVYTADRTQNRAVAEIDSRLEPYLTLEIDSQGVVRVGLNTPNRFSFNWNTAVRSKLTLYLGELNRVTMSGSGKLRAGGSQPFPGNDIQVRVQGSGGIRELNVSGNKLELSCSGSGSINMASRVDQVSMQIGGSGKIDLNAASTTSAKATVSGSGSITLRGDGQQAEMVVAGSGSIRAEEFRTRQANVQISGSGSIRVFTEDSIEGTIAGSGNVRYKGNPQRVDVNKRGSGSIRAL